MTIEIFPPKSTGETVPIVFNFLDRLQFGEMLNGAAVAVVVASGIDPNPSAMLSGIATIHGAEVTQDITGGLPGVMYALACTATGDGAHNYVKQGHLAVLQDVGNYVSAS